MAAKISKEMAKAFGPVSATGGTKEPKKKPVKMMFGKKKC